MMQRLNSKPQTNRWQRSAACTAGTGFGDLSPWATRSLHSTGVCFPRSGGSSQTGKSIEKDSHLRSRYK